MQRERLGARLAIRHLVENPPIGELHSITQPGVGLPTEYLLDQRIVRVSAIHTLRSSEVVSASNRKPGDILHDVNQVIDRDELTASQVDGIHEVALHQHLRPTDAIGDELERSSLLARAPDLD